MKIGIIGAGFTGLAAGYYLAKQGCDVAIFEKDAFPGGLAVGYKEKGWEWSLEKHYHHWFTNDSSVLTLAKQIGYDVLIGRPKTSSYIDGTMYQLDSPITLLKFSKLTLLERLRMALVLGALRYSPFWKPFERMTAGSVLPLFMGNRAYRMLWEPLLKNKFSPYADDISLAWFWARVKKRTTSLVYPKGGFLAFAEHLVQHIKNDILPAPSGGVSFGYPKKDVFSASIPISSGSIHPRLKRRGFLEASNNSGKFFFNTQVKTIASIKDKVVITCSNDLNHSNKEDREYFDFDKVIVTLPSFLFIKIAPELPHSYREKLNRLKGLGAINLILRLKEPFLKDGTYWLNMCESSFPFLSVVEHTNFMGNKYYNNEHIVYVGKYLPYDHPYMKMNADDLLKVYHPYLKKIHKNYRLSIIGYRLFKAPFAQPIIPVNYSKMIPPFETPLKNVYLANIQQVYPWDRGTNYAVELGERVARLVYA